MRRIPLLAILCVLVGCAAPAPQSASASAPVAPTAVPTPSPSPTPTPAPTPEPTLPPLDMSVFQPGWTQAASESYELTTVDSTIGPVYAVAVVCVGDGELTVTLRAAGGDLAKDHPDGVETGSLTVQCPLLVSQLTSFDSTDLPAWHGVSISPSTSGPQHLRFRILVGTAGPG